MRVDGIHGINGHYIGLEFDWDSDLKRRRSGWEINEIFYDIKNEIKNPINKWIKQNLKGDYTSKEPYEHNDGVCIWKFWFENEEDAMAFKLRWS